MSGSATPGCRHSTVAASSPCRRNCFIAVGRDSTRAAPCSPWTAFAPSAPAASTRPSADGPPFRIASRASSPYRAPRLSIRPANSGTLRPTFVPNCSNSASATSRTARALPCDRAADAPPRSATAARIAVRIVFIPAPLG